MTGEIEAPGNRQVDRPWHRPRSVVVPIETATAAPTPLAAPPAVLSEAPLQVSPLDEAAVLAHLTTIHDLAKGIDGQLILSSFGEDPVSGEKRRPKIKAFEIGDADGTLAEILAQHKEHHRNPYLPLAVHRRGLSSGSRGTEADIVAVLGVVADLDADTGKTGTLPLAPSLLLETSPGNRQAFVFFDEALSVAEAKPLAAALREVTGADHGTADVDHVWRIPGTLNWPNKKKLDRGRSPVPTLVTVLQPFSGELMPVEEMRAALIRVLPLAEPAQPQSTSIAASATPRLNGASAAWHCPAELTALISNAADIDRSADFYHAVGWAKEFGATPAEIEHLMRAHPGGIAAKYLSGRDRLREEIDRSFRKTREARTETSRHVGTESAAALAGQPATAKATVADGSPPRVLDIMKWRSTVFAGEAPPIEWLIKDSIPLGIPFMVAAQGDVGKSMLLVELGRRLTYANSPLLQPIFGGQVACEGTAVIVTAEDDANTIHRRLADMDPEGTRSDKLIIVPLPNEGGALPLVRQGRNDLEVTDQYRRICDQLVAIRDLVMVVFDPLQAFVQAKINEDPAAGQFVCAQLGALASVTGAAVGVTHHVSKSKIPISTLTEARHAIRGTTALVDGLRLAQALWPLEDIEAKRVCRELHIPFEPNKIVRGGVVKANVPARRLVATYVRNEFGLLIDRTVMLTPSAADHAAELNALVEAIDIAARAGQPLTKTGLNGVFEQRARLPEEIRKLAKHKLTALADEALDKRMIVASMARGSHAVKWLDVPGGEFAIGLGEFRQGAVPPAEEAEEA